MSTNTMIVRDLRRLWKPHKERLGLQQTHHPTAVRFHRACSWLDQSQQTDADQLGDLVLIQQWTALNALYGLYGRWNEEQREPVSDRQAWRDFFERILTLDASHHVVDVLQSDRGLVLAIIENAYLNGHFWDESNDQARVRFSRSGLRAQSLFVERRWLLLMEQLLERIYLLRYQLVHGAATFGSKLNRKALGHCTLMMGHLLPAVLRVWIDHGADVDLGGRCVIRPRNRSPCPCRFGGQDDRHRRLLCLGRGTGQAERPRRNDNTPRIDRMVCSAFLHTLDVTRTT